MIVRDLVARLLKCPQHLPVEMEYEPVGEVVVQHGFVFIGAKSEDSQEEGASSDGGRHIVGEAVAG